MNKSFKEKFAEEVAKSHKRSGHGHLDVRFNNHPDTKRFNVRLAEEKATEFVLEFALFDGPDGPLNLFIEVVIKKAALSKKIEFPTKDAEFLYQSATEEWRPTKGWIRGEWNQDSRRFQGLLEDIESNQPDTTKVTWGKFDVTIDK